MSLRRRHCQNWHPSQARTFYSCMLWNLNYFFPQSAIYCSFLPTLAQSVLTNFYTQQPSRISLVQKAYCSFQKWGELGVEQASGYIFFARTVYFIHLHRSSYNRGFTRHNRLTNPPSRGSLENISKMSLKCCFKERTKELFIWNVSAEDWQYHKCTE